MTITKLMTMKAARVHHWGGSESLQIDEIPVPEPKSNEVLIRVRAAGVNPIDWKAREGYLKQSYSLPLTLGWDIAGDVAIVGRDVSSTDIGVGAAVYGETSGNGFAQFVAMPAANLTPKPVALDYVQAAAVPVVGQTAWQALFDHGGLHAGQKVLIHAAAGGIGSFAVQLAKWKGAYVIGTASADNREFVLGLGADEFIDYRAARFEEVVYDADLVLDNIGGNTLDRSYNAAKPGGIVVTTAGQPSEEKAKARGVRTTRMYTDYRERFDELSRLIDEGHIKVIVSKVFSLDQIRQALDLSQTGHVRGKIVVEIP